MPPLLPFPCERVCIRTRAVIHFGNIVIVRRRRCHRRRRRCREKGK